MCFEELCEGLFGFLRAVCVYLVCMLVIGPVLIIVGITMLASPNNRSENIQAYNRAVANFEEESGLISRWSGSVTQGSNRPDYSLSTATRVVPVQGNIDNVRDGTSTFQQATMSSFVSQPGLTFKDMSWGSGSGPSSFTKNFPFEGRQQSEVRCSQEACVDDCFDSYDRECSDSSMRDECRRLYGNGATFISNGYDCEGSEVCGRCEYQAFASTLCAVVEISGNQITESASKSSCYYPFGNADNQYTATGLSVQNGVYQNSVTIQLRSSKDPFVILQELTEGRMDFGITEADQRSMGVTALIAGIIITVGVFGGCFFFIRHRRNQKKDNHGYGDNQQQYNGGGGNNWSHNNNHGGYPQQQQPYEQPQYQQQQPYGQQPPPQQASYPQQGYPQPAYGAPPPPQQQQPAQGIPLRQDGAPHNGYDPRRHG